MKRRFTKLVVFLLLGTVVNVAVAWGITAHAEFDEASLQETQTTIEESEWPRAVPRHWPSLRTAWESHPFGWVVRRFIGRRIHWDPTTDQQERRELFYVDICEVGWPSRCLQWESWREFEVNFPQGTTIYRNEGHPVPSWWRSGITVSAQRFGFGSQSWKALPIHPVYFGFVINTIFYAVFMWCVTFGPFTARRVLRRKRGHCIKCGYDVRGDFSAGCPECGWQRESLDESKG